MLPEAVSCPACEIRLEPEIVLGDARGAGLLESDTNWVRRDERGRYHVSSAGSPYFWVFDTDGTLLRRVGAEGQGPGEFRSVTVILPVGDRLYAFDTRQRRVTIYTADFELLDTVRFPLPVTQGAVRVGGQVVVNALDRMSAERAYPLHVVGPGGEVVTSFGSETGEYDPRLREFYELRSIAAAGNDAVWSAPINEYKVERWDLQGRFTHVLRREVDWLPSWRTLETSIDRPPDPMIVGLSQQAGLLWVLGTIADPEWSTVVVPSGRFFTVLDRHRYRDSVLEAIDLDSGEVVASTRFDRVLRGFVGEGMVYGQGVGEGADEFVDVLRFEISGRE